MSERIVMRRRPLVDLGHDELIGKLEWAVVGKDADFRVIETRCGGCERLMTIGTRHSIAADGTVDPSYVCAFKCGWHVFVRLDGWDLPPKKLGDLCV